MSNDSKNSLEQEEMNPKSALQVRPNLQAHSQYPVPKLTSPKTYLKSRYPVQESSRYPGKTYIASRRLPTKLSEILISLIQNSMLLFQIHLHRVLMRVAMKASAKAILFSPYPSTEWYYGSHTSHAPHLLS